MLYTYYYFYNALKRFYGTIFATHRSTQHPLFSAVGCKIQMRIKTNDNIIAIKTSKTILTTIAKMVAIHKKEGTSKELHILENEIRVTIKNVRRVGLYNILLFWIIQEIKNNICIYENKNDACFVAKKSTSADNRNKYYDLTFRKYANLLLSILY